MNPVCCDTSFLFSLYGADAHTRTAMNLATTVRQRLSISVLNIFELENALRAAEFRGANSREEIRISFTAFEADLRNGGISVEALDLNAIVEEARRISAQRTIHGGHRAFDVLHVAAALHLKAGRFFSFDQNQRRLAQTEGLKINP
jgi:predicted nucleic acid-binding protein